MNTGPIPTVDRFRCSGSGFHDDGEDDDGLEDDIADSTVARYTSLLESRVGNNIISFLIICGVIFDFRSLVHLAVVGLSMLHCLCHTVMCHKQVVDKKTRYRLGPISSIHHSLSSLVQPLLLASLLPSTQQTASPAGRRTLHDVTRSAVLYRGWEHCIVDGWHCWLSSIQIISSISCVI